MYLYKVDEKSTRGAEYSPRICDDAENCFFFPLAVGAIHRPLDTRPDDHARHITSNPFWASRLQKQKQKQKGRSDVFEDAP